MSKSFQCKIFSLQQLTGEFICVQLNRKIFLWCLKFCIISFRINFIGCFMFWVVKTVLFSVVPSWFWSKVTLCIIFLSICSLVGNKVYFGTMAKSWRCFTLKKTYSFNVFFFYIHIFSETEGWGWFFKLTAPAGKCDMSHNVMPVLFPSPSLLETQKEWGPWEKKRDWLEIIKTWHSFLIQKLLSY